MKLESRQSVFNMGDTSIRVKQVVEINRIILEQLRKFLSDGIVWDKNREEQENFYRLFIQEINRIEQDEGKDLFSDFKRTKKYKQSSKKGMRGRTLTNVMVKNGFTNSSRIISKVGLNYLNKNLKQKDPIEKILSLSYDNLVYLRQYLKLRIYDSESDCFFYNFRFALLFLMKYTDVPKDHFLTIIESVRPYQSEKELEDIILSYDLVQKGKITFAEYYMEQFSLAFLSKDIIDGVKEMFRKEDFSEENFIKFFENRKSKVAVSLYREFVLSILEFKKDHSEDNLKKMISISKNSKIKKAFSEGHSVFHFNNKMNGVEEFIDLNKDNKLLSDNDFDIFRQFFISKKKDIIKEYSDMCRRAFQITGLIKFENGIVNLTNKWIIEPLLAIIGDKFKINGIESYSLYEKSMDSIWFDDLTLMEILNISEYEYEQLLERLSLENGFNIEELYYYMENKREEEYREFIYSTFPKEKVVSILKNIMIRNDDEVYKQVTDNATVPTIYEYMLTIAWFYISKHQNFYIHKSFGVSLDGNKLPLIHQGGGKGDIEIFTNEYKLLIEATLMDSSTQRRGELEPVIRHSINFMIDNNSDSQTIFIANELDNNVMNIC